MFFSFVKLAHASLEITEIMYNPDGIDTNREWVKLHNNGSNTITVISGRSDSAWRFSDDIDGKELHLINNELIIAPGEYAVLASNKDTFILEHPEFNGPVADTSMSLNNISGTVRIWDGSNPRIVIAFKEYPYSDNSIINEETNTDNINNSNSVATTTTTTPKPIEVSKIITKIISPKIVTAGVPFSIEHQTTGLNKEKVIWGKFVWNFGDGMKKEWNTSDPFLYTYEYPGEYVISLSYSDSPFDIKPDAVDRLTIKVVPSGVSISSVGDYADPYIEIENNSNYEMSLYKWIIKGSVHSFLIPEGMVILPNKKLKLSPKITRFDFNDLSSISIVDSSGQVFATYPKQKTYTTKNYSTTNSQDNIVKGDVVESSQKNKNITDTEEVINLNDLGANVAGAGSTSNGLNNKNLVYLGLAGIILIGIVSVVLIRRKNDYPDYVEGGITANDMKIIE